MNIFIGCINEEKIRELKTKLSIKAMKYLIALLEEEILVYIALKELLEVSRSGYYKWLQRSNSDSRDNSDVLLREEMQNIVVEFPGIRI